MASRRAGGGQPASPDPTAARVAPGRHLQAGDLRAAARLASQATAGLVDLVEAVHARVARPPLTGPAPARTSGITGLVYRAVRGVGRGVGSSVDGLLGWLAPAVQGPSPVLATPEREAVVAALNGVLGDHLAATASSLATPMALRVAARPLTLTRESLAADLPGASGRVLVLAHGLCMNDLQWQRDGHDHGALLAQAGGWAPLYLHYNTGLHIDANGVQLAALMAALTAAWPVPISQLALLGHSMGGLVARRAVYEGQTRQQPWARALTDLVCLGSPHHGAPLERAGHGVDRLLGATPWSAPFARLARLRSAGITDLRHGRLLASDGMRAAQRSPLPLPAGVRCFTVAATLSPGGNALKHRVGRRLLGDGLVPVASALGQHTEPRFDLGFAPDRQWLAFSTGHLDLLGSPAVGQQLVRWLK